MEGIGTLEDGYAKTQELLCRRKIPTAVLYNNDLSAMGGIAAMTANGLKVPGDISVIGFDNIAMSRFTVPSLTTIDKPIKELTENTVRMLMKKMENPHVQYEEVTLAQNLIVRDSTGPARR